MSVKRWTFNHEMYTEKPDMLHPCPMGRFVEYTDYKALETENQFLKTQVQQLQAKLDEAKK